MRTYTASRWFWPVLLGLSGGLSVGLLIFGSLALGIAFSASFVMLFKALY